MRNKFAVPLIVIGVLLMLVGIGQRTFWAPPDTVTASAPSETRAAPLTVIGSDVLTAHPDGVDITVSADQPFLLAVGRAGDVDAWVDNAAVERIGVEGGGLSADFTDGEATVPNPAGSDLWVLEQTGDGELTYSWDAPAGGDWQLLLATDGTAPAPSQVSVTWANEASTPFAVPLIVLGGLLAVLGLALAFISGRGSSGHRSGADTPSPAGRRTAGAHPATGSTTAIPAVDGAATPAAGPVPSTGQPVEGPSPQPGAEPTPEAKPAAESTPGLKSKAHESKGKETKVPEAKPEQDVKPGTPSAFAVLPRLKAGPAAAFSAALAAVLAFGAVPAPALASQPLSASPEGSAGEAEPPVVVDAQLERILGEVAATVQEGDAAKRAGILTPRVGGTAYALREANYAVSSKVPELPAPAPVAAEPILTDLVMGGTEFPRSVVAVTQGDGNTVPQALMLVQASARENYKLVSAIQMLPGTTFPKAPAGGAGVEPAAADAADGLLASPQAAVSDMADALTNPTGGNKDTFAENTFAEAVTRFQADVVANPENEFANISFNHSAVPADTHALHTADGGAIVFGYMSHTYSSVPREAGDSINLEGTIYQTLTGQASTEEGIDVNYGEAVMLYVPAAGSGDRIQVIGAAQELLSANLK